MVNGLIVQLPLPSLHSLISLALVFFNALDQNLSHGLQELIPNFGIFVAAFADNGDAQTPQISIK